MVNIGNLFLFLGGIFILLGLIFNIFPKIPLLPGDIFIKKEGFNFYFPITTSIILSLILSLIWKIISK